MSGNLLSDEFVKELSSMVRWYRSQLEAPQLRGQESRNRKPMGMVPFVLTEALDGTKPTAKARKLGVRRTDEQAQIVAVGDTAEDGTFTLDGSGDIDHDASASDFQSEMDSVFGAGNTVVTIGGGVWLVRFTGSRRGTNPDLLEADSAKLGGSQLVSVKKTLFNAEVQEITVFDMMPSLLGETLPIGTIGYAYHFPGVGYGIIRHNRERPTVIMYGKADANIASGASGTVSIYRGTTDTTVNITAKNLTDQQADSGNDVEITEYIDENSAIQYGFKPLECPA